MQHPSPLWPWPGLRRALYMMLLLISETRKALIAAAPGASSKAVKTRMEIREHDYSFNDGAQERPVIEVVSKDVKTSDIFRLMQVIGDDKEIAAEEGASWWKDAVLEEFSRQDLVVLALIALCVVRLAIFAMQMMWKVLKLPLRWLNTKEKVESGKNGITQETWRRHLEQLDEHNQVLLRHRNLHRLPSNEEPSDEVLQQLHELTKELPQGFTPDMFTSLGNAMHEAVVAPEPEKPTGPDRSPDLEMKQPSRPTDESVVCA